MPPDAQKWLDFAREDLHMAKLAMPGSLAVGMPDQADAEETLSASTDLNAWILK